MTSENRLAREKSPYLLQHQHNPVDWYPWGDEAFERARAEDKPIFLSIGYSTCHWCHVMERESFESHEIAELLNDRFVSIKVDREERPDVDRVYMAAVQAMTGAGGWPLSAWLTHDLRPFYTGTYFPPDARYGRPGFPQVLRQLSDAWRDQRERVEQAAAQVGDAIAKITGGIEAAAGAPGVAREEWRRSSAATALRQLASSFDPQNGGFSDAPKFPRPTVICFLLAHHHRTGEDAARNMAMATLRAMWRGGINDHLGGGFHRYSVDPYWRVPHFEKMLYDQAQLVWSYIDAFRLERDPLLASAARQILDYVGSELTDPGGGFYSAEDADSAVDAGHPEHKEEGAFYLWEKAELEELLGDDALVAIEHWGVTDDGNTISDPQQEFGTRNVLYAAKTLDQVAAELSIAEESAAEAVGRAREALLAARRRRPRPHLDDKVITSWNGLMISAFARAADAFGGDVELSGRASRAADFVLDRCRDHDGALTRRYRDGEAAGPAQLEDHAAMALGLVDLYHATFAEERLAQAEQLADAMIQHYHDRDRGAFYDSRAGDPHLLVRTKEAYDGAEPSGNSLAARVLWELGHLLDRADLRQLALEVLDHFRPVLERAPQAVPHLLEVSELSLAVPEQVVIVGARSEPDTSRLIEVVRKAPYHPWRQLVVLPESGGMLRERSELFATLTRKGSAATAYLCRELSCGLPLTEPEALKERLATRSVTQGDR